MLRRLQILDDGDFANNSTMANATIEGLASAGTSTVLSWCPSCQISIGEVSLPNYEKQFGEKPFDLNPFLVFLADRADELAALMVNRVEKRVALHERPVFPQTMEAVRKLAAIIPGVELVELDVPRIGTQANTLAQLPKFKNDLLEREFRAAADAGVTTLATIYHADHREICDAATGKSFEIVNFMELLGEALGIDSEDAYKRLKQIKDIDDMIIDAAPLIEANRLDLDTVRDALAVEFGRIADPCRSILPVRPSRQRAQIGARPQIWGADALILDLEDSVAAANRPLARKLARAFLETHAGERIARYVRINPLASGLALDDLVATVAGRADGILLPKCAPDDVRTLDHYLSAFEAAAGSPIGTTRIIAIATETPTAVFALGNYAGVSPRLASITWGAEDLSACLEGRQQPHARRRL